MYIFLNNFILHFCDFQHCKLSQPPHAYSLSNTHNKLSLQRTLTIGESITVRLTSCLTSLDLTKQVKLLFVQHNQSTWIQQNK